MADMAATALQAVLAIHNPATPAAQVPLLA
jgi:hypothetical protein